MSHPIPTEEYTDADTIRIDIDGTSHEVIGVIDGSYLKIIETDQGDYFVAEDSEEAGKAARQRWVDMVDHDPTEFRAMVGDECLVEWALGNYAGPGSTQVKSINEWLDLHLDCPEEEFASYDGEERSIDGGEALEEQLGFVPNVAYRCN